MNDGAPSEKKFPFPRWMLGGFVVLGVASIAGLVGLVVRAVSMIRDGRGAETYRTSWLVEFSWIGVLVFLAGAVLALVIAALLRWREERQWRALERRYGTRNDA